MSELLKKINELEATLETEVRKNGDLNRVLEAEREAISLERAELARKETDVAGREAVVRKIEDVVALERAANDKADAADKLMAEAKIKIQALESHQAVVEKDLTERAGKLQAGEDKVAAELKRIQELEASFEIKVNDAVKAIIKK